MSAAVPDDRTVVRGLVALKLRLLRNGLRRRPGRAATSVLGSVVGLLFAVGVSTGLAALHGHRGAGDAAVVVTGALTLMWAALPLFLFAGDESADPTRLAMLPLPPRALVRGSLLAALIGPGPVLALVLLGGAAVAGAGGGVSAAAAVLGVPLAVVTLVVLSRAVAAANARLLASRRGKDFAIFGGLLFALLVQTGNVGFQAIARRPGHLLDLSPLHGPASVVRWIPPVSAVDAARTARGGAYGPAALQLLLTAGLLVLLLRWWERSLRQLLVTADASTQIATRRVGRTRTALPDGRTAAVMQRHLRYVWREPRAKAAVFTVIGMAAVFCVLSVVQGWASVYVALIASAMVGLQTVNLFGMDGSAFWMVAATIATPADARAELRGRALAVLSFGVPVGVGFTLLLAAVTGDWASCAPALGLSLAVLGCGVGLGLTLSVLAPYTMPADGNPMRNAAPGQNGLVLLNSFGSLLGVGLLTLPLGLLLLVLPAGLTWLLLPVGPAYGALLAVLGLRLAAARLLGRLPEILAVAVER